MSELKKLAEVLRAKHSMDTPPGGMQYVIDVAMNRLATTIDTVIEKPGPGDTVEVEHFKESGKYNVTDMWRIPEGAIGPHDMVNSPDFRDIGCTIVVPTQEPWGYPAVLKTVPMPEYPAYVPLKVEDPRA